MLWIIKELIWSMVHKSSCWECLFSFSLSPLFCSELQNIMRLEFVRLKNTLSLTLHPSLSFTLSLSPSYTQAHRNTHLSKPIHSNLQPLIWHIHTPLQREDFLLSKPFSASLVSSFRLSEDLKDDIYTSLRKWQLLVCLPYFCSVTANWGHTHTHTHTHTHVRAHTGIHAPTYNQAATRADRNRICRVTA